LDKFKQSAATLQSLKQSQSKEKSTKELPEEEVFTDEWKNSKVSPPPIFK